MGLQGPLVDAMERFGEEALIEDLQRASLLGWKKGRVGLLGRYYAHAGAFMRTAQSDIPVGGQVELMTAALPREHWRWDEYRLDEVSATSN